MPQIILTYPLLYFILKNTNIFGSFTSADSTILLQGFSINSVPKFVEIVYQSTLTSAAPQIASIISYKRIKNLKYYLSIMFIDLSLGRELPQFEQK